MYNFFIEVMRSIRKEEKEKKQKENKELIKKIENRLGECKSTTKEFIEIFGVKGFNQLPGWKRGKFPNHFYIFSLIKQTTIGNYSNIYLEGNYFTFEDAINRIYDLMNFYIESESDDKFYVSYEEDFTRFDSSYYTNFEMVRINKHGFTEITNYKIVIDEIIIRPDSQMVVPGLNGIKEAYVYEF